MIRTFSAICTVLLSASLATAGDPVYLDLFPSGKVPGQPADTKEEIVDNQDDRIGRRVVKVTKPRIAVYSAPKETNTKTAVVVCPGGGYNILAYDHEGVQVAEWLNSLGVTAIILEYRVPRSKTSEPYENPLKDAQRAMRVARAHAEEWNFDPNSIGIMGFSAGGNLAAVTSNNADVTTYDLIDEADKLSARPDFSMLIYPAYLNPEGDDTGLTEQASVDENTPPALLIHTHDDRISSTGSIAYYLGLKRNKIPAELHIFPEGGHGYGLRKIEARVSGWPELAARWLQQDIIKKSEATQEGQ